MIVRLKMAAMGAVFVVAVVSAIQLGHSWQWLVCLALLFSWLGDALLARVKLFAGRIPDPFIAGMGAFALAQITYAVAFGLSIRGMPLLHARIPSVPLGREMIGTALLIYLLAGVFFWLLLVARTQRPMDLKIAALLYCLLLCAMGAFAFSAAFTGVKIVWPLIVGSLLFLLSDGFIAAREFGGRLLGNRAYELAVWGTYLPAQVLLMIGTSWLY